MPLERWCKFTLRKKKTMRNEYCNDIIKNENKIFSNDIGNNYKTKETVATFENFISFITNHFKLESLKQNNKLIVVITGFPKTKFGLKSLGISWKGKFQTHTSGCECIEAKFNFFNYLHLDSMV